VRFIETIPILDVQCTVHVAPPHGDAEFIAKERLPGVPDTEAAAASDSDDSSDDEAKKPEAKPEERKDGDRKEGDDTPADASADDKPAGPVETGFRELDVITCTIVMTHSNLKADDEVPPTYTPFQDTLQREQWYVLVCNETGNLVCFDIVREPKVTMRSEVKFQAPRCRIGKPYVYTVYVVSGNYVELEFVSHLSFEVTQLLPKETAKPEEPEPEKEGSGGSSDSDEEPKKEEPVEEDDDEDLPVAEDEDAEMMRTGLSLAQLRKRKKRLERKGAAKTKGSAGGAPEETSEGEGKKPHDE